MNQSVILYIGLENIDSVALYFHTMTFLSYLIFKNILFHLFNIFFKYALQLCSHYFKAHLEVFDLFWWYFTRAGVKPGLLG